MKQTYASGAIRAVVIDDNALFLETARALLSRLGMEHAGSASSGSAGLALTERVEPDLVLLDLMMPEMNGLEVLRRIRRNKTGISRVLLMSGHRDAEIAGAALEAGADAFVHKHDLDTELERLADAWFGRGEQRGG